jgi:hypothetical protein
MWSRELLRSNLHCLIGTANPERTKMAMRIRQEKAPANFAQPVHRFSQGLSENSVDDVQGQEYLHARLNRKLKNFTAQLERVASLTAAARRN